MDLACLRSAGHATSFHSPCPRFWSISVMVSCFGKDGHLGRWIPYNGEVERELYPPKLKQCRVVKMTCWYNGGYTVSSWSGNRTHQGHQRGKTLCVIPSFRESYSDFNGVHMLKSKRHFTKDAATFFWFLEKPSNHTGDLGKRHFLRCSWRYLGWSFFWSMWTPARCTPYFGVACVRCGTALDNSMNIEYLL